MPSSVLVFTPEPVDLIPPVGVVDKFAPPARPAASRLLGIKVVWDQPPMGLTPANAEGVADAGCGALVVVPAGAAFAKRFASPDDPPVARMFVALVDLATAGDEAAAGEVYLTPRSGIMNPPIALT
jgi:hypothetical protein